MKKLGFGLMRLPLLNADNYSQIEQNEFNRMADQFIARGFTYFDTAYPYHNGYSEVAFRKAVVERYPRDKYTITDKLPTWMLTKESDMEPIFEEQLKRCGVEYFDYYWIHTLGVTNYEIATKCNAFAFLQRLKEEGRVKHIGFSYHDKADLLDRILTEHPETEYVQLQINYLDWENPIIESRKCYEIATKHHKPVIVMEPVRGGVLAKLPEKVGKLFTSYNPNASAASWAIRYAASLDNVFMVLSGMSNEAQLNDNTSFMQDFQVLNEEERKCIEAAVRIIKEGIAVPCTACHYCTDGCPQHIAIPEYFSLLNTIKQFGPSQAMNCGAYFENLTETHGKPSDCIECGQCESHCPQHISIIKELKEVGKMFE